MRTCVRDSQGGRDPSRRRGLEPPAGKFLKRRLDDILAHLETTLVMLARMALQLILVST